MCIEDCWKNKNKCSVMIWEALKVTSFPGHTVLLMLQGEVFKNFTSNTVNRPTDQHNILIQSRNVNLYL